jgi:hypothetical protein
MAVRRLPAPRRKGGDNKLGAAALSRKHANRIEKLMMAKQSKKPAYRDGDEMIVPCRTCEWRQRGLPPLLAACNRSEREA